MKSPLSNCGEARRDLLRRDDLDAVGRGLLDMHLRRCDDCRGIAEALARIEQRPEPGPEISEERILKIYSRLVPAVHQITTRLEQEREARAPRWRLPAFAFGVGLLMAAIAVAFVLFGRPDAGQQDRARTAGVAAPREEAKPMRWAAIERREGFVRVDGLELADAERFPIRANNRVELGSDSRLRFRLGDLAKIDLSDGAALALSGSEGGPLAMRLDRGILTIDFNRLAGRRLTVITPDLEARVKGTVFTVEARPGGPSSGSVIEGVVEVIPLGDREARVELTAGQRVSFPDSGPGASRLSASAPARVEPVRHGQRRPGRPRLFTTETPGGKRDAYARARAEMAAGDLPRAIALLERANAKATGEGRVAGLALIAECYRASGMYGKAADAYGQIVEIDPGALAAENARYEIGRIAMDQLGDIPRARAAFAAYIASPKAAGLKEDAYFSLCELDGREGAHQAALRCFDRFLKRFGGGRYEPSARLWRGALYQDVEQRWDKAEQDLLFFLKERPRHPRTDEARYRVALGRFQRGDKAGALQTIREYMSLHPNGKYQLRVERLRQAIVSPNATWEPAK